ncbi:SGNH/GDSL hydrolase family protein [Acinetobacter guillouiae]|uniref:SGNH/GDSL hydrolase family protein n=1 Tax=Acinetobacter guillouiae TaxID=106649 RepID=UPI003AF55334
MADNIVTKQQLIDAGKNADSWEKYWSGNEDEDVITRLNKEYPTHAKALKILMENGGLQPFETQAQLLASVPVVSPTAAKALDTKKVWIWKQTSAEGAEPKVYEWIDTGLSEVDLAKEYTDEKIKTTDSLVYEFAIADKNGNVAFGVKKDGHAAAQKLDIQELALKSINITEKSLSEFSQVWVDDKGFIALGIRKNGSVYIPKLDAIVNPQATVNQKKRLSIGVDDCILHVGDSMTASHYCVQDKSYVSQLSQLSPFRHVNYGVSGNDLLNMQSRVLNDTKTFGATLKSMKPRFVFIASFANDGAYINVDLTYYQENMRRLVDVCLGHGVQPVLITYFTMNSTQHQAVKAIADEYNIDVIHNDVLNKQVGTYNAATLFHQGHTGTRNNGLWWMPMLDYIKQQKALKTIKIYRKRSSFAVTADSDLLFKDQLDKSKKWKEISIGHYSLANEYKYDELDSLTSADLTWALRDDEYVKLADKSNVAFTDFALVEVKFDALIKNMQSIEIGLKSTGSIEAYVRNNLDKSTELARLPPTDPIYQANWNKPRGAWRKVDIVGEKITIASDQLIYSTVSNTLFLMLKGSFNLSDLYIDYVSDKYESASIISKKKKDNLGSELVQQPYCGTTAQLNGWTVNGTIAPIIPIDVLNAPRKNGSNQPIDGVVTLSTGNYLQQSVSFASSDDVRVFKVTVWARYYAKAYFDMTNSKYSSLDASQIIDRNQSGAVAPISRDTLDLRNLKIETWTETTYPVSGGADQQDYVGLQWRPVDFYIEVLPFESTLNIRLSASDSVQLAKLSVKEVL